MLLVERNCLEFAFLVAFHCLISFNRAWLLSSVDYSFFPPSLFSGFRPLHGPLRLAAALKLPRPTGQEIPLPQIPFIIVLIESALFINSKAEPCRFITDSRMGSNIRMNNMVFALKGV